MEIKRTTDVFVRTDRKLVIYVPEKIGQIPCPRCQSETPLLAAEIAAALLGISRRAVYQFVETGAVHFVETERSEVLVCPASLRAVVAGDSSEASLSAAAETATETVINNRQAEQQEK